MQNYTHASKNGGQVCRYYGCFVFGCSSHGQQILHSVCYSNSCHFVFCGAWVCIFKIKLSDSELAIYQYFMRIAKIRRSEICNIYFAVWAKNGQGSALVIETKNKTFTFPVRLYGKENVDNLITEIKSKIIIQPTLQKSRKNESFVNPTKFLLVIAAIIILLKIFTKS